MDCRRTRLHSLCASLFEQQKINELKQLALVLGQDISNLVLYDGIRHIYTPLLEHGDILAHSRRNSQPPSKFVRALVAYLGKEPQPQHLHLLLDQVLRLELRKLHEHRLTTRFLCSPKTFLNVTSALGSRYLAMNIAS